MMDAQLNQETVNDTAKLIMHRLIARTLARDPTMISRAKLSHSKAASRFPNRTFVAKWEELLRLPPRQLRTLLTSRNQEMMRLRLSSPFVTAEGIDFSAEVLRRRIRQAAKRIARRSLRSNVRNF